jgi:hypothetical protein
MPQLCHETWILMRLEIVKIAVKKLITKYWYISTTYVLCTYVYFCDVRIAE